MRVTATVVLLSLSLPLASASADEDSLGKKTNEMALGEIVSAHLPEFARV